MDARDRRDRCVRDEEPKCGRLQCGVRERTGVAMESKHHHAHVHGIRSIFLVCSPACDAAPLGSLLLQVVLRLCGAKHKTKS